MSCFHETSRWGVLACFEGLQQGKRILELAFGVAEARKKSHSYLEKISEVESILADDATTVDKLIEAIKLTEECQATYDSLDSEDKEFLGLFLQYPVE